VYLCKNIQSFIRRRDLAIAPHRSSIANSELERSFPSAIRCVDDYFYISTPPGVASKDASLSIVVTDPVQDTTDAVVETDPATTTTTVTEAVQKTTDAPMENKHSENK